MRKMYTGKKPTGIGWKFKGNVRDNDQNVFDIYLRENGEYLNLKVILHEGFEAEKANYFLNIKAGELFMVANGDFRKLCKDNASLFKKMRELAMGYSLSATRERP